MDQDAKSVDQNAKGGVGAELTFIVVPKINAYQDQIGRNAGVEREVGGQRDFPQVVDADAATALARTAKKGPSKLVESLPHGGIST